MIHSLIFIHKWAIHMTRMMKLIAVMLATYVVSTGVLASAPADGTLTATRSCEAYISKNKRTNPDHAKIVVGQSYAVIEVNKVDNPSWYRLNIPNADPQARWVADYCGVVDVQIGKNGGGSNECSTPGLEDSYVLALSWQPSFCETHRHKPECQVEDKKSYQARNFTLHGLWPNKRGCGIKYEFCGEVRSKPGDFCDYPALTLFTEVRNNLKQVMPSAAAGSCLQRHEWFKHGTCQTQWSIDEYFDIAVDLTKQFNESGMGYFMSRNVGEIVAEDEFIKRIDCTHGLNTHKAFELKCKDGNLVDVYIHLTENINEKENFGDLVRNTGREFKSNCGGSFKVDPIGFIN